MLVCLAVLVVVPFFVWAVAKRTIPDATESVPLAGSPLVVVNGNGNGLVYSATAAGRVTVVDAVNNNVVRTVDVQHPVTALAVRSNALFALGPGVITRLSTGGRRELKRTLGGARPTRLAAGPKGLWAAGGRRAEAIQIDPQTLEVRAAVPLRGGAAGIVVTRKGAWISQPDLDQVVRVGLDGEQRFARVETVTVPGRPGPLATTGGKVVVLTDGSHRLSWFDESAPHAMQQLSVDPDTNGVAATGSSAWTIVFAHDAVVEIDLDSGERVGSAVRVAPAPGSVTADLNTLWTTSARNALTRVDLAQLDTARRRDQEWNTPWGLDPRVYLVAMVLALALWLTSVAQWRRADPNAGLPAYEIGPAVRVVARDPVEWPTVSYGTVHTRRERRESVFGGAIKGIFGRRERSTEEEFSEEPIHAEVLRVVASRLRVDGLVLHGLSFVNGARRRHLPFRVRGPRASAIRRRFALVGPGRLCLLRGSWRVDQIGGTDRRLLVLDHLYDRVRGDWVPVPIAEEAWLHVECELDWLTDLGRYEVVPGADVELDILALSCRVNGDDEGLRLRLIVAYQRLAR